MAGKVLVVEDDVISAKVIHKILSEVGLEPLVATNLEEARNIARQEIPPLAICDVNLPDGLGLTLIKYLRAVNDRMVVVMTTGGGDFDVVLQAMREGATDFVQKPFSPGQLRAALYRALKSRSGAPDPLQDAGQWSVLLVEDDETTLDLMEMLVRQVDAVPVRASSLDEARAEVARQRPDVVVTDVHLGRGSGLQLAREIRTQHPDVQVIVVTGGKQAEVAIEAMRLGVFDLLTKPFDASLFHRTVLAARRTGVRMEQRSREELLQASGHDAGQLLRQRVEQALDKGAAGAPAATGVPGSGAGPGPGPGPGPGAITGLLLRCLPAGVIVLGPDGRIVDASEAALRMLHVARPSLIGHAPSAAPALEPFRNVLDEAVRTGQPITGLATPVDVAGERVVLGCSITPLVGPELPGGILIHLEDLTLQTNIESYLRHSDRLASVGMLCTELVGDVTGPLNVALGHANLLVREAGSASGGGGGSGGRGGRGRGGGGAGGGAGLFSRAEKIQASLKRVGDTTANLLRLVHSPRIEERPCDMNLAVTNACGLLSRKLQVGSHEVQLDLEAKSAEVMGDAVELEQLVLNLVLAACGRGTSGGTLGVRTSARGKVLELAVHHDAQVIPQAELAHLLDPYPGPEAAEALAGLGLVPSICRHIVERHGGTIAVESGAGKGTQFTVRLPMVGAEHRSRWVLAAPGRAAGAGVAAGDRSGAGTSPAVVALLADAGPLVDHCRKALEAGGCTTRMYSDPLVALERLSHEKAHVMVLDADLLGSHPLAFFQRLFSQRMVPALIIVGTAEEASFLTSLAELPPHRVLDRAATGEQLLQAVTMLAAPAGR
jgi:DNA-binding NtrC family response regulator/signal transduction histidine kinase